MILFDVARPRHSCIIAYSLIEEQTGPDMSASRLKFRDLTGAEGSALPSAFAGSNPQNVAQLKVNERIGTDIVN